MQRIGTAKLCRLLITRDPAEVLRLGAAKGS
jgi:hypothetical protein